MKTYKCFVVVLAFVAFAWSQYGGSMYGATGLLNKFATTTDTRDEYRGTMLSVSVPELVVDSSYMVGPGDLLTVTITGSTVDEEMRVVVNPEGMVTVPKFGSLKAFGNLRLVKEKIAGLIISKTRGVEVRISLTQPKPTQIDISGQLPSPGTQKFDGITRLSDAIIAACGGRPDLPAHCSFRNVKIHRHDGGIESVDLSDFLLNGNRAGNPYLYTGDRVVVENRKNNVTVTGAIARPQTAEWRDETLFSLIAYCGGLSASSDSTIRINRYNKDGITSTVLKFPNECIGFRMAPEDNIIVGTNPAWRDGITVSVSGRVRNPGVYTIQKKSPLSELIALAGGLLEDADSAVTYLQRPEIVGNYGTAAVRGLINDVDVQTAITKSSNTPILISATADLLQEGDVLSVPRRINSVGVTGKVARPGFVNFETGKQWKYFVNLAGGFEKRSYEKYAKVYKRKHNAWVSAGDAGVIDRGDIILIPELPQSYGWNVFKDLLAVTSGIVSLTTTIIILSR